MRAGLATATSPTNAPRPNQARRAIRDLLSDIKVAEIMTPDVHTVNEQDSLVAAGALMQRYGIRHLPVMKDHTVTGLLSDIMVASSLATISWANLNRPVSDVMTREVVHVSASSPLPQAARLLGYSRSGAVVVVDHGVLRGLLTATNLVEAVARLDDDPMGELEARPGQM